MEKYTLEEHRTSEKSSLLAGNSPPKQFRIRRKPLHHLAGIFVAVLLFAWWSYIAIPDLLDFGGDEDGAPDHMDGRQVRFDDIIPSEKLDWHPCYGPFFCARLTVPMDYHRPLNASINNPKVHVALILLLGKHSGPNNFSISPLLLNPGGPGGSGVQLVQLAGDSIQKVVGEDQDVIGFDPRGIGATTPPTDCYSYPFEDSEPLDSSSYFSEDYSRGNAHRFLWEASGREIGVVNSSSSSLQKLDIRARTVAKLCEEKDILNGKDSILKYVNTPNVARDMLSIVDAWDEWTSGLDQGLEKVQEDAEKTTTFPSGNSYTLETKGKLVYWGFSYGTLLGATFAAMFPDRVGRVLLDGVVDADHYVAPVWTGSIRHTDEILDSFSKYCHEGGEKCALYRKGDEVRDVDDRFQGVLNALKENPVTIIQPISKAPVVITYNDIRLLLFTTLYSPSTLFPVLALLTDLLYRGQPEILGIIYSLPYDHEPFCGPTQPSYAFRNEAQVSIMCSDKRYPLNETLPNLEQRFEKMLNTSSFADVWMTLMLGCDAWAVTPVDPPMRWDNHPAHKQKPINTSFPLFFLGNSADPVTPLHAALKMAKKFTDSGLVEQTSEGHCSLSAVSICTILKIRSYFTKGHVPPHPIKGEAIDEWSNGNWTICEADEWPFHPFDGSHLIATGGEEAKADVQSMNALKALQKTFFQEMDFLNGKGVLSLSLIEQEYPKY